MFEFLTDRPEVGLRWSACAADAASDSLLAERGADRSLSTASVGKILLLIELARRFAAGELERARPLERGKEAVGDSGLWQAMDASSLSAADAARLVGAVSDNVATNVLLDLVGLAAVTRAAADLGLTRTALLDRVRDDRLPEHPPALSRGSAAELARLAARLHRRDVFGTEASSEVVAWLSLGTDLSMVASAFGLDPLAHREADRGIRLWNKTGTDAGVRADVGVVTSPAGAIAYAVLAEWDADAPATVRDDVLTAMRRTGDRIRAGGE
ncbi:serine hydrolase [Microbacterium sp. NPDC057407]|uniref:serine hydrolase n=1 Tax=Microbacterium sp. NPDC057407 TaxID=3346120 RepID=UPI00366B943C